MIVDTNFIIWLDEEDPNHDRETPATDLAQELRDEGHVTRLPSIVVWELYVSIGKGTEPIANQRSLRKLLSNLPIVPLNDDIARRAGILYGVHASSDSVTKLNMPDSIIAATAVAMNEPVITDDGDFDDVDGVERVSWL